MGVTTAPVPVCPAVLWCVVDPVVDPQPAAATRVAPSAAAMESARTARNYPVARWGKRRRVVSSWG